MKFPRLSRFLLAAAAVAAISNPVYAQSLCEPTFTAPMAELCVSGIGNDATSHDSALTLQTQALLAETFGGQWTLVGKSDDLGFGPFTSNPGTAAGTLTFDTPQDGLFVVSFKTGNSFAAYLFDGAATSISFSLPKDLSHASLWQVDPCKIGGCPTSPIPEPSTMGLMVAGVGALMLLVRRRKL